MPMIRQISRMTRYAGVLAITLLAVACSDSGTEPRADVGNVGVLHSNDTSLDISASLGTSAEASITLSNTGRRTVHIGNVTTNNASFTVVSTPDSIAADRDALVVVGFTNNSGPATGVLTIVSDSFGGDLNVALRGIEPGDGGALVTYTADILPIFEASCIKSGCHASAFPQAGLFLGDYNLVIQRVVAGSPSTSLLYNKLQPTGNMPADSGPLVESDRELIRQWILDGAPE